FDIESDLKEIEFLLYQDKDSSLKDSIDQMNRAHLANIFVDSIPAMFNDEHTLDYSSPLIFDVYVDNFLEVESDAENIYNDPFDSKGENIKKSKLLIDELDLPCDFHPPSKYDSFFSQDFSRVDALPSTNNEDKIFNPCRNHRRSKQRIENSNLEEQSHLIVTMTDNRTMAELLRAPTECSPMARKRTPRSITTWEDLVSKFINEFFPPSRTTNLRNEILNFPQRFDESFHEAWDRYKDLLRACPHHSFTELHQLDTFYNALNPADQDSLNVAAGGNLLERSTQDVLTIIENKTKVRNSRSKPIASQVKACDVNSNSSEIAKLTHSVNQQTNAVTTAMTAILKQFQANPPPALVKDVEETCVTCGVAVNYNLGNPGYHPPASTSGSGCLPSNTVANPKGELKAITTRSGLVIDGPTVPTPSQSINPEEDERVKETFTDPDLAEYTIKVPPPHAQKYKPLSQREFFVHQRDPRYPNISYPSRMLKQKQQEKDEVQIHKVWLMFKQLHINITLADALILMPKYQKMLKALLSNKEKLQELANTPLNENCSAVIVKKLPEKLEDPGKFLIQCGFSGLKCKSLADLGASINLMPLSVWKKLGLPELVPTSVTLELANRAICTPAGIARDVFISVGKFTFTMDFVIVDYESYPRVPFTLGRRALIDVHGEEMILRDDFLEDLFLYQPSGNPTFSLHTELTSPEVNNDIFDSEGNNVLSEKLLDLDSTKDLHPPPRDNPLSGSTTYPLLEEFADELPSEYDDNLPFDIESDLKEIEFLLYQDKDSSLKDSIDQKNRAHLADIFVDSILEMFPDEHTLDYSSPSIFDVYDDDFLEVESDAGNAYDDPFAPKGENQRV
nr:reverse transcriptase domain-containing protein [Tanacetum cinerariifolium]